MSSTKFTEKRIGYLAASQSFHQDTEVALYTSKLTLLSTLPPLGAHASHQHDQEGPELYPNVRKCKVERMDR